MSRFSLPQLEAFLWIARLKSFRAAADKLNVTQPTVSLRIRDLEAVLDVRLFERGTEAVSLTAEGAIMLSYVEQGLDVFAAMQERLKSGDPLRGVLRVGASDMFAMSHLPQIMGVLEVSYPQLRIELRVANSVILAELLNEKLLDLAFLVNPSVNDQVSVEYLYAQDVAWVSSPSRALPQTVLRARDLVGINILTSPPLSPLHALIVQWFAAEGIPTPNLSTCTNIAVTARLVAQGVAMSALPLDAVRNDLATGALIRYQQKTPFREMRFCVAYKTGTKGSGIDEVVRIAREVISASHNRAVGV